RFHGELHVGEQESHRALHLFVADHHDLLHEAPRKVEGVRRCVRRAKTVRDGVHFFERLRRAGRETATHTVRALRLHSEYFAARLHLLDSRNDSRNEPATPDGHDHRVEILHLKTPLESDSGCAEHGQLALEWMDEGAAFIGLDTLHRIEGLMHAVHQHHVCTVGAAYRNSRGVGGFRHHYFRAGADAPRSERHG